MKLDLEPDARRALRAEAHHLNPVVMIGTDGLTPAVLHEIDVNLLSHGLIKVRVFSDDRDAREAMLEQIADDLDAAPVQHIGKLLVLYRPVEEDEPAAAARPAKREAKAPRSTGGRDGARPPRPTTQSRIEGDRRKRPSTGAQPRTGDQRRSRTDVPGQARTDDQRRRRPPATTSATTDSRSGERTDTRRKRPATKATATGARNKAR